MFEVNKYSDDYSRYNLEKFAALLSRGTKMKDTEKAAGLLLNKYGSVDEIFAAPEDELLSIVGQGLACYIRVIAAVTSRRTTDLFEFSRPHTLAEIAEYLKAKFMCEPNETVIALFKNDNGFVVDSRVIGRGTVNMSDVATRRIIEVSIETGCKNVILAHNHPMGVAKPSTEDITTTNTLFDVLKRAGIVLEYHLVVAGQDCDVVCPDCNFVQ